MLKKLLLLSIILSVFNTVYAGAGALRAVNIKSKLNHPVMLKIDGLSPMKIDANGALYSHQLDKRANRLMISRINQVCRVKMSEKCAFNVKISYKMGMATAEWTKKVELSKSQDSYLLYVLLERGNGIPVKTFLS